MKLPTRVAAAMIAAILGTGSLSGMAAPTYAAAPATVPAETAPAIPFKPGGRDVLILMDMSGSMNEEDSKSVVKIDAAKKAILDQLQEVPATARIGLMTYPAGSGSTSNGCKPAQIRVPVSNSSVTDMGAALGSLPKPDGETPTSDAMLQAASYLKAEALSGVTIVLVSDGQSNCGGDPCETAKKLKSENINITVNTVGFDISSSGQSELECVAAASGGTYVPAQDASQLAQVLKDQLGNGLSISITAPALPVRMLEASFSVGVTVSVAPGHNAANVQLEIADTDPSSGSTVRRPVMSMGNLGSGVSIPTRWLIRPPTNQKLDKSTYRVTAKMNGLIAASKDFTVNYTHEQPSGTDLNGSLKDFKNVVVLGDSYSSGEGAGDVSRPYFAVGDQVADCHRSKNQYANWLYKPEQVHVLACSGAITLDVYRTKQHGEDTQLDQLNTILDTGYRPDAIFLSITGNDIGFGHIAKSCLISSLSAKAKDAIVAAGSAALTRGLIRLPSGADPLASCPASEKSGEAYTSVQELISSVKGYLFTVLVHTDRIFNDRGLETPPIIVIEYPELLAKHLDTPLRCDGIHPFQTATLGAAFRDFGAVQEQLNKQIKEGVEYAKTKKNLPVHLASTAGAVPPGHNMCSAEPWFVPLTLKDGVLDMSPEVLHPNVAGHQAMAASINAWAADSGTSLEPAKSSVGASAAWRNATLQWWPTASTITVPLNQPGAVSAGRGSYGSTVIHVTGGAPLTGTTIYVRSTPMVVGSVQLDENGNASLTVDIQPADLPPGEHTVNVLGVGPDGMPVVSSVPISIAQPFPLALWGFGLIAALLLGFSARILLRDRRARRRKPGEAVPAARHDRP